MTGDVARCPRIIHVIERGIAEHLHLGAQLYVSQRGEVIGDGAVGEARAGVALRPDHLMLWMSSVKPVIGVAIAQQHERGRLHFDDRVCRHVPEFGCKGKEAVTIRHVLTHTGGFRAVATGWSDAPWDSIIAEICDAELETGWVPGQRAGYHVASGWYILAEVIRRIDGRSFDRYVRDEIFKPLGMGDSWVGMPREQHAAYGERIAGMHVTAGDEVRPHFFWPWSGSADGCAICRPGGSAWGPIRELGRLYESLQRGGAPILQPESVAAIVSRQTDGMRDETFGTKLDRGLGVVLDSKHHGEASAWYGRHCSPGTFGHGGYLSSVAFADPEHELVVALVFNGMTDEVRHAQRVRTAVNAVYEDLGLSSA